MQTFLIIVPEGGMLFEAAILRLCDQAKLSRGESVLLGHGPLCALKAVQDELTEVRDHARRPDPAVHALA